jgi:hypothetical protein
MAGFSRRKYNMVNQNDLTSSKPGKYSSSVKKKKDAECISGTVQIDII